jgi:hypothetical protein
MPRWVRSALIGVLFLEMCAHAGHASPVSCVPFGPSSSPSCRPTGVPEMNPASGPAELLLLSGIVVVLRSRRRR